ncbi:MAG: AraC family transcriptional activator of pobA [Sulfurimonas sp.]|jgi:AraC family transcriptional activator of pobA|uniref:AraC family transcriptional regulator n=1 Tax=Sulfurimonas sp. TaxID=2022749 RepID=UPI0039E67373
MNQLPLLSIEQSLDLYKDIHAKNPSFGMDIFDENFIADQFVILENNGKGNIGPYSRCAHYILILSINGTSIRHINQHDYQVEGQSLQLLVPGVIHSFEDTSEEQNSLVLLFDKEFLPSGLNSLVTFHKLHHNFVHLLGCEFAKVQYIFEQLNYEYRDKDKLYKEVSQTLVTQLLLLLKRQKLASLKDRSITRAEQIMSQYLNLIEEHYQNKKSVQEYADILEITPKHLSETVKEVSNRAALHFIHIRILKELQYLLVHTNLSVKQIASVMNFENASDLGRFFKRYESISPSKYRISFQKP